MSNDYDVIIAGGGLAGLSLARQLTLETPHLRLFVAEKRKHPVPEAAFKVGESTVEIAAHYFGKVLNLEPHLRASQLDKLGLRYFFPSGDNSRLDQRFELGPAQFPATPSFQLDRGRFENYLLQLNRDAGVDVVDGTATKRINLGERHHEMLVQDMSGKERIVRGRWIVDASGRAALLRRQLGLTRPVGHHANACWFRIGERLMVDTWSADTEWLARVPSRNRWLSTNHLMGRGYWVWLIPLGSGSTSVGIVVDDRLHPYDRISKFDRALDWLREFEPQCARVVEPYADSLEDFLGLRHFAFGASQVFSGDRWALSGEAGVFTDPFYSPGSDFIGMGNSYISDLIKRESAGEDVRARAAAYDTTYLRLFDAFLRLYEGQYRMMGNAQVMTAKVSWDNACYWAITALLFFQGRYRDMEFMASIDPLMRRFFVLHARMQSMFNEWDRSIDAQSRSGAANVTDVGFLRRLQADLSGPTLEDGPLRARLDQNFELLERCAKTWQATAAAQRQELGRFVTPHSGSDELLDLGALRFAPLAPAVSG